MEGLGFNEVLKLKECHQCQSMICWPPPALVVGPSPQASAVGFYISLKELGSDFNFVVVLRGLP